MSGIDPDDWARSDYEINCVRAIETAAAKLGMDPATLATNCANGEIGTLAEASRFSLTELRYDVHGPAYVAATDVESALQPFRET